MNITKKLFFTSLFLAFFQFNLHAKTQGHYFGPSISYIKTSLSTVNSVHAYKATFDQLSDLGPAFSNSSSKGSAIGLEYAYSFNKNNIFIMPRLFYDKIDAQYSTINKGIVGKSNNVDYSISSITKINDSYGYSVNIGYDIDNNYSIFTTIGNRYTKTERFYYFEYPNNIEFQSSKNYTRSLIFGIGTKYQSGDNAIILSYEPSIRKSSRSRIISEKGNDNEGYMQDYISTKKINFFRINILRNF